MEKIERGSSSDTPEGPNLPRPCASPDDQEPHGARLYAHEVARHPLADDDLRTRVQKSPLFGFMSLLVRTGTATIRPTPLEVQADRIPYQLVISADSGQGRPADQGVPDISTALRGDCYLIARNIDLPDDLSPGALESVSRSPLRPAEINRAEYSDRVYAIVQAILAPELARLQNEAAPLWEYMRSSHAQRTARVDLADGVRRGPGYVGAWK